MHISLCQALCHSFSRQGQAALGVPAAFSYKIILIVLSQILRGASYNMSILILAAICYGSFSMMSDEQGNKSALLQPGEMG